MKKRFLSLGLAVALTLSMSFTAFAAESSTTAANSSQGVTVEKAQPGQTVKADTVKVAVVSDNGTVSAVTLPEVVENVTATILKAVVVNVPTDVVTGQPAVATPEAKKEAVAKTVATVEAMLTTPATEYFSKTVEALAEIKGADMVVNNMGSIKTAATATDIFGNVIASVGVVEHVTPEALILLMAVNADGTIEYVEGVVDPVTGAVVGAFKGTPAVITVLVLA